MQFVRAGKACARRVVCGRLCSSPPFCSDSCRAEDEERKRKRKEEEAARFWKQLEDFNMNPGAKHCFALHRKGHGNVFLNTDGSEGEYDRETLVAADNEALLEAILLKWRGSELWESYRVEIKSIKWFKNALRKCHKCGELAFEERLSGFMCGSCGTEMLRCADCGVIFPFTAGEQKFFRDKGFTPPKRCKSCRANRTRY